jgi:predicted nucleic acid-binding protein
MVKQFFDTNILLYQFDDSAAHKRQVARERVANALADAAFVISTQVMMEFYSNITRKFARALTTLSAQRLLLSWSDNNLVVVLTPQMIVDAASLRERFALSWWDANIVVAAQRSGAEVMVTEDMQHGQVFDAVRVENPFLSGVHEPRTHYPGKRKK